MVRVPSATQIPPPEPAAALPETTLLLSVKVPELRIPPPALDGKTLPVTFPLDTVKPDITTVFPELMVKMRKFGVPPAVLRCTVSRLVPGPLMLTLVARLGNALLRVIAVGVVRAKEILLPLAAPFAFIS